MREENYPLSPMQQGMLFHSLYEQSSGVYIEQVICSLHENVNVSNLIQSWQRVVERHSILRTGFDWDDSHNLQHSVYKEVKLPIEQQNWQNMSLSEQSSQLNAYLKGDRQKGFNIAEAPLMRLALFQLAETDYKLVWTFHHALLDGRSIVIILKEVFSFYKAFGQNQELKLEPAHPYGNYIDWLGQQSLIEAEKFWKQQLQGFEAPTQLLIATKSEVETKSYNTQKIRLSQDCTSALQNLAQENELTFNTLVQGAYALLLSRYSGQEDIVFGATRACKRSALKDMDSMVGLFINTLPVRVQVDFDKPLLPWLKELSAQWISLSDYEHTPLVKIQEWSEVPKGLSLFESLLVFENYELNTALRSLGGIWESREFELFEQPNYPLTLTVYAESELILKIDYDSSRFDAETIRRILGHLETLLNGFIANPQQCLGKLPLLTAAEKHQLLVEWNDTQADYPQDKCIHQLFEEQVEQTPDAVAVVFEDEQLTYRELNARANQLAHYLHKLGVGPEVLVGICVERSLFMLIGLLGILKAAGAYVPLDPNYPKERLAFMLEDAQVSVLLTQQTLVELLSQHSARVVYLDTDDFSVGEGVDNPICKAQSSNLAYVLYTSGSTGNPKGVAIEHRSTVALLSWATAVFSREQLAGVLASTSFCFDISVFELFVPLSCGGKVILAENALHLSSLPAAGEVTLVNTVPSAIAELVRAKGIPDGVCTVNLAGEALPQRVVELLYQQETIQEVFNLYGPSEDTVYSTYALVRRDGQKAPPIGRPIANTQVYILDAYQQPVPIGLPGELHLGGAGLARGYLNRPELTQEKFIPHPFDNSKFKIQNSKLYKTGDLVRYLPDGNIEFLGRIDHQVKFRGNRIELGEIESVLGQHPDVREVVVRAREDVPGDKRLFAYVVANQEQANTSRELRRFLKDKLPDYMMPSAFVLLNKLPRTPNGKVNRRALPVPDNVRPELEETFVAPRTPVEDLMGGIFAEVLGLDKVGVQDNFFELGGHSLLATQVISRLRDAFSVELSLYSLFEAPTISRLGEKIEVARREGLGLQAPPILPRTQHENLPLSFAQQRLWFLDQLVPDAAIYNIPLAYRVTGELNVGALEQSLVEIVRRHEALRTTFAAVDGQPIQVIAPKIELTLPVVDLGEIAETKRAKEVQRLVTQEAQQPFDLTTGPLLRLQLLRLDDTEHVLLLTMHHIVSDGWSLGVLMRELAVLYEGFSNGKPTSLPELPIHYADFALWQREWFSGDVLESQLAYWKQQLGGELPVLELPTDRPRPPVQTYRGARQSFELSKDLREALKALSRQEGVTLFMTLLAAFKVLLYRYTGQENVIVGSPIANRNRAEIEGLIGFFVNTLVLRSDLSRNPSFRELLGRVREVALGAYAHQDMPFERLVEELQPERDMSYNALFQVMFVLQNSPMSDWEFSGLALSPLEVESKTAKFDLSLSLTETEQGLVGAFGYNTDLFDEATIVRMVGHLRTLLEGVVVEPDKRICELPILTEAERYQLLVEWNDTEADYPKDKCIHQLFEEQVERTPDNVAVVFEDEQLTYRELNAKANQLAHYLQKFGVGPEVLVGICVERSIEMIVGVLGILKAGGAYVPLDTRTPKARLSYILEDAKAGVLLTQQRLVESFSEYGGYFVCLDANWNLIQQESFKNPTSGVAINKLAYGIYTSGSTGKPKGVLVEHRSLGGLSAPARSEAYNVNPDSRVLQFAPLSFSTSVPEIFMTLLVGATLYLAKQESLLPGSELTCFLREQAITNIKVTPSLLAVMPYENLPALQTIAVVGDNCSNELVDRWATGRQFLNSYGATEASICGTVAECIDNRYSRYNPSIGRSLANTKIYILDPYLQPVPIGVPGVLYIGGCGLARGYLNQPDLTAERFIRSPFSNDGEVRMYKTGDLAYYLPDGNIMLLGRIDNQIKIRGFRIELEEIETVLTEYITVKEAVVIVREDLLGDKRLVGYIVLKQNQSITVDTLRHFLKQKLPNYMIPSAFVFLCTLPLNRNGKIDRINLPAPDKFIPEHSISFVKPRTPIEKVIADIWSQVLQLGQVSIHDNFFELGGHSLLATQVVSRLRQTFSEEISIRSLFELPTVAELANRIETIRLQKGSLENHQDDSLSDSIQCYERGKL
jgi:amino acid adenylation domain-containing protein